MKTIKISFLFFCLLLNCFFCNYIHAQKQTDSLQYYYNLFISAKESTDYISSYIFFEKHKKLSLQENDTLEAIRDLRYMFFIQNELGQFYESETTAVEALQLANSMKTTKDVIDAKIGIYNRLGILARKSKNYNRALEYYDKILGMEEDLSKITTALNNKAYVYKVQKKYKLALREFSKAYKNSILLKDTIQTARALSNLGLVQSKLNHIGALANILKALEIRNEIDHISGICSSYLYLSEYYKDRNQKDKTLFYANKALKIGESMNNIPYKVDALSYIVELDDNPNIIQYKKLTDSISEVKQLSENKFASIKYDYAEEKRKTDEAKIKLAESQLIEEKERQSKILFQVIVVFTLFIAILLYFLLKYKYKKRTLEQVYKTETRISKKVHDEVANDMYQVMTKLQSNSNTNENVIDDLEVIYNKTRDISKENSDIDLSEGFGESIKDLLSSYKSDSTNIITKDLSAINWNAISDIKKTTIYRVLQELMTNMKKHSDATIVALSFNQKKKKINIDYSDNGCGCNLKKNSGLQNAENRIKTINGSITFDSKVSKGFKAKISI